MQLFADSSIIFVLDFITREVTDRLHFVVKKRTLIAGEWYAGRSERTVKEDG